MLTDYHEVEERISQALYALQNRQKAKIAPIAREFGVPYQRLKARYNGRISRSQRPSFNSKLSEMQELAITLYLDSLERICCSASPQMVVACANSILKQAHTDPSTTAPVVDASWFTRWRKRHPEYKLRKAKACTIDRKASHVVDDFVRWFSALKKLIEEHNIQPADLYNFDETGFRIGVANNQWIVIRDASRASYLATDTERELVTSMETISADGNVLPPLLILPGKMHQSAWYTATGLPSSTLVAVTETGYSNDEVAFQYIQHFKRYSGLRQQGAHRLLLCDGHGSHHTREFLAYAEAHNICTLGLPAHTTHILQPLDVVVFQPLKYYHSRAVAEATRTGCTHFNKLEFLAAITSIRAQTFKASTIKSAFKKTGLYPFDPEVVIGSMRERRSPTLETPSQASSPPSVHTPYTPRALESFAYSLTED